MKITKRVLAIAVVLVAAAAAQASDVYMNASDTGTQYSFNSGLHWNDATSPSAGNGYFTGAYTLQANSAVFAGNSLQIDSGGKLALLSDTKAYNLTLDGGTLASSGGARNIWSGGSQIVLKSDSILDGTAGTLTIHSPISGDGGLTIKGSVKFYNDFSNFGSYKDRWWYSGNTTIENGGTLEFSYIYPAGGEGKGDFIVNTGGTLTLFRTANINGLSGSGRVNVGTTWSLGNNDASGDFSGVMAGGTTLLTKTGTGTQIFSGANTYTGATAIKAGTLQLDYATQNNSKLADAAALTLSGGTLRLNNGSHTEVVASTTLGASSGSSVTRGAGSAILRMNAIARNVGSAVNFGAAGIADTDTTNVNNILGGWATINGQDWAVNSTNAADGAIAALSAYDGAMPSSGGLASANYIQAGSLSLAGAMAANTVKISNTANSDSLNLGANNLTITSSSATSLGGILYVGGNDNQYSITGSGRIVPSTANQELIFNVNTGTLTVSALIGAAGASSPVTKAGPGTLVLAAANGYTGATTVAGGTLSYGINDAISSGAVTVNGGTLAMGTYSDTVGAVALTAGNITGADISTGTLTGTSYTFANDSAVAVSAILGGGSATLSKSGSGVLTLTRANTYGGLTTISEGRLAYGCNNAIASGGVTVNGTAEGKQGAVLDMGGYSDTVGAVTVGGGDIIGTGTLTATSFILNGNIWNSYFGGAIISEITANLAGNAATLTKSKAGYTTLSGTNTYTGATTIAGGVLRADDGAGLPVGSLLTISGADLGSGKYAVIETSTDLVRTGGSDAGNMRITGGVSGFSAHGGPVRVAFGTLESPTDLTWGSAPFNPTTFVLNAITATDAIEFKNAINLNGAVRSIVVETNVATLSGVLSGTGLSGLLKGPVGNPQYDIGTLVLTGANSYTGVTTVNYGAINIGNATALGTTDAGTTVASGAALEIQGGITVGNEALSLTGTGINGTGALRNKSGANVWRGTVTLAGATLITSDAGSLTFNTAATSITGTQNLTLDGAGDGAISGAITTGTGTLTKNGAGKWVLGGANTYTGTTTINGGKLLINGDQTAATGNVTVNSGAILGGTGIIGGAVTIASGGKLAPGASIGELTINKSLNISAALGGASESMLFELGGTNGDKVTLTGVNVLTIGGGLLNWDDFVFTGAAGPGVYTLFDTNALISGTLGTNLTGMVGVYEGTLSLGDSGNDLQLTLIPEPATMSLLVLGGMAALLRRRRK
ncbi:MAG: autotransporter-associated beta strand repeat-containing protein [Planctomycetaceae bacterium]|nr:autotransporter-associated beta strand repeat-containing protein [Planctomycetaceae bacterium]